MADTRRRTAADARRIADKAKNGKVEVSEARDLLRRTHDRGVEEGRAQMRQELNGLDVRATLLDVGVEVLDSLRSRVSATPNSSRTQQAFGEAAAVLRDAKTLGEPPADPEPEPEPEKPAKARGKKGG